MLSQHVAPLSNNLSPNTGVCFSKTFVKVLLIGIKPTPTWPVNSKSIMDHILHEMSDIDMFPSFPVVDAVA